ncbi:sugar transferase [Campylobacter jejuni subsp. doylei]|nr:sugar transferase [Campylobacter jejuni subsp. doylei]
MGGGYLTLFKKLYKIKKQHQKEKQIYQETIKVFPQLKYPNLETCPDYSESLRYKFHLSYMLGEVLIKADKTWHKGGGFKLKNNIKKVNKEFQIFREIFKEFDQINSSVLKGLIDNKQLFLKEFPRIKNILKIHQDYKAILDNIFHNFNYFIQNFDLIEEWLLSDDFKERYKKENHPYPSLLDPKKLNDNNEEINYHNIPAELAWEMNLPLPDRYEFVVIAQIASGKGITSKILDLFNMRYIGLYVLNSINVYIQTYILFLENSADNCLVFDESISFDNNHFKFLSLIDYNHTPVIQIVRDPFKRMATVINHVDDDYYTNGMKPDIINNEECLQKMFNSLIYPNFTYDNNELIVLPPTRIPNISSSVWFIKYYFLDTFLKYFDVNKCFFLDLEELNFSNLEQTVYRLKKIINKRINKKILNKLICENLNDKEMFWYFPLKVKIDEDIQVLLMRKVYDKYDAMMVDITNKVLDNNSYFKEKIVVKIHNSILLNAKKYNFIKIKLSMYLNLLLKLIKNEVENNYKKPLEIMEYVCNNKFIRNRINSEIYFLKQHRPDIVASWKYYQEFERMCKELDENNQNPSL